MTEIFGQKHSPKVATKAKEFLKHELETLEKMFEEL